MVCEGLNRFDVFGEEGSDVVGGAIAEPNPDNFRGWSVQDGSFPEIGVLSHDDEPVLVSVLPDFLVGCSREVQVTDVAKGVKLSGKFLTQSVGEVLIEQKPHEVGV